MKKENVKAMLRNMELEVGSFVTKNDDSDVIELHVLKDISGDIGTIITLSLTESLDDVYTQESMIPVSELIAVDESFANVNGYLWNIRQGILHRSKLIPV